MSRLITIGFETNSGAELQGGTLPTGGSIVSTQKRTGLYSLFMPTTAGYDSGFATRDSVNKAALYFRMAFRTEAGSAPASQINTGLVQFANSSYAAIIDVNLLQNTNGTFDLQLKNAGTIFTTLTGVAITAQTWHVFELYVLVGTTGTVTVWLDNNQLYTNAAINVGTNNVNYVQHGYGGGLANYGLFIDDIGLDDAARVGVGKPIAYVGVSSVGTASSGNLTLTEPAGVAQNDLLVAEISYRSNAAFTLPAGWSLVATQDSGGNTTVNGTGSIVSCLMAYIIRGASAPDLVFPRTAGDVALGRITAFRADAAISYDTGSTLVLAAASATVNGTTITTALADELLVMCCAMARSTTATGEAATDPTSDGWREVADSGTTTGADGALAVAWATKGSAGSIGTPTYAAALSARHGLVLGAFKQSALVLAAGAGSFSLTGTAATLRRNLPLIAGAGSYAIAGTAASLLHKWKLTAAAGSYALTGTAASLRHGWKLTAGSGSYTLAGTDATLRKGLTLAAGAGAYTLTGTVATLRRNLPLVAGAEGSYSLSGTAASLLYNWKLAAAAGAYSVNGTAATLLHNWRLSAAAGSYVLTGANATLRRNLPLVAGTGAYALTGTNATLIRSLPLVAGAGSYALTGTAATLHHGWVLAAGTGAYVLTGSAVSLIAASNKAILAEPGSYTLTGTAASLLHAWRLSAGAGSYSFTGSAATLTRNLPLLADAGSYSITGTAAALLHGWKISAGAEVGSYALTGTNASLLHGWTLAAGAGSYALTGTAASLRRNFPMVVGAGSYALTGSAAELRFNRRLAAAAAAFTVTGAAASLEVGYVVVPQPQPQPQAWFGGDFGLLVTTRNDGIAAGELPLFAARARGVRGVVGRAKGSLPQLKGQAVGRAEGAQLPKLFVVGRGTLGVAGQVRVNCFSLRGECFGRAGLDGKADTVLRGFNARALGNHDPDEAVIVALLMAA